MYQVRREEARGPLGILKRKTPIGELKAPSPQTELGLSNGINLALEDEVLTIRSTGPGLFRVDLRAQPQTKVSRSFKSVKSGNENRQIPYNYNFSRGRS